MHGGVPLKALHLAGALALAVSACVPPYEPPAADQPHAIVKVRRSYETTAGTSLREGVTVDEHAALRASVASRIGGAPRTDAFLAHPVPGTFAVSSGFFHTEMQMVRESYQESHTEYRSESYDCSSGFGSNKSYRTCTRSSPHTVYETKYRDVMRQVEVSDGQCTQGVRFAPRDRHVYLLQYTYHNHSACSLSCFEQVQAPEGFKNLPCPLAPPDED
jgi:hypothetical protein